MAVNIGTLIGNVVSLIICAIFITLSFFWLKDSCIFFVGFIYLAWVILKIIKRINKPAPTLLDQLNLDQEERRAYNDYATAINFPAIGSFYSSFLNFLRVVAVVWGIVMLVNELYFLGTLAIIYFVFSGGLIGKFNPYAYMLSHAKNGNSLAINELTLIETVKKKIELYSLLNPESRQRHHVKK